MELKRNPHGHVEILSCFPCVERCAFTENLRHSSLYVYTFFVQQCQKVITWRLRIILTVTCHSLSFILTTLGIQAWIYGFFPPFISFLKELGDGGEYQRTQSWIDFCFALSFTSWLCQMQCVSHAVSLFSKSWLGQLVSIQRQGKENKILPSACWDCKYAIRLKAMYWRKKAIADILVDWNLPV